MPEAPLVRDPGAILRLHERRANRLDANDLPLERVANGMNLAGPPITHPIHVHSLHDVIDDCQELLLADVPSFMCGARVAPPERKPALNAKRDWPSVRVK